MKLSTPLSFAGLLLGLLSLCVLPTGAVPEKSVSPLERKITHEEPTSKELEEVEEQVRAFLAHYIETLESKNEAEILTLFVNDERFAWYTDGAKSYSKPEDVLASMRRYAGIEFKTVNSDVRVVPLGTKLASVRSRFHTVLTIPGPDDYEFGGVITWLVEKSRETNQWRVILGHTSTPGGPPGSDD